MTNTSYTASLEKDGNYLSTLALFPMIAIYHHSCMDTDAYTIASKILWLCISLYMYVDKLTNEERNT